MTKTKKVTIGGEEIRLPDSQLEILKRLKDGARLKHFGGFGARIKPSTSIMEKGITWGEKVKGQVFSGLLSKNLIVFQESDHPSAYYVISKKGKKVLEML